MAPKWPSHNPSPNTNTLKRHTMTSTSYLTRNNSMQRCPASALDRKGAASAPGWTDLSFVEVVLAFTSCIAWWWNCTSDIMLLGIHIVHSGDTAFFGTFGTRSQDAHSWCPILKETTLWMTNYWLGLFIVGAECEGLETVSKLLSMLKNHILHRSEEHMIHLALNGWFPNHLLVMPSMHGYCMPFLQETSLP